MCIYNTLFTHNIHTHRGRHSQNLRCEHNTHLDFRKNGSRNLADSVLRRLSVLWQLSHFRAPPPFPWGCIVECRLRKATQPPKIRAAESGTRPRLLLPSPPTQRPSWAHALRWRKTLWPFFSPGASPNAKRSMPLCCPWRPTGTAIWSSQLRFTSSTPTNWLHRKPDQHKSNKSNKHKNNQSINEKTKPWEQTNKAYH